MTRKSICEIINNKDGAALVTVLVVFLTLVVIVTTSTQAAVSNYKRAVTSSEEDSVLYIAETGINEAYEALIDYYETSGHDEFRSGFANDFVYNYSTKDGKSLDGLKVISDYGKIMNEVAKSEMTFILLSSTESSSKFELKSTGYLSDKKRTVKITMDVSTENISTKYQPNANVNLDLSNPDVAINVKIGTIEGPFMTNKVLAFEDMSTKYIGPLVTNNQITLAGATNFSAGVIITSDEITVNHNSSDQFGTIIFKPGGSINFTVKDNSSSIKRLLLPISSKGNESIHFKTNGVEDASLVNKYVKLPTTQVAYYDPENFDPYAYTDGLGEIGRIDWRNTFEEAPSDTNGIDYDYRDYFKTGFILDNMDNTSTVEKYLPAVRLPEKPSFPTNLPLVPVEKFGNETYIDANSNMVYKNGWYWNPGVRTLDWRDFDGRYFNSISLEGGSSSNQALKLLIGNNDVTIVTRKLDLTKFFEVVGSGTLRIYVIGGDASNPNKPISEKDLNLNIAGITQRLVDATYTVVHPHRVQLIVYETKHSTTNQPLTYKVPNTGGDGVSISVFSQNMNLDVSNLFKGNFITAEGTSIRINNTGSNAQGQLIFAPKATVELLGGRFEGVITSKDILSANAGVTFKFKTNFDQSFVNEILPEIVVPGSSGESSSITDLKVGNMIEVNE